MKTIPNGKLSESLRRRVIAINQAQKKLEEDIKADINMRMNRPSVTLEKISQSSGIKYPLLSLVRNGRRRPTDDFILSYTKYLEEIGE